MFIKQKHNQWNDFGTTKFTFSSSTEAISTEDGWSTQDYLPLHSPHSSSVSLQWTYRDGDLVNLPQVLLVESDVIVVRPGRPAPGRACKIQVLQISVSKYTKKLVGNFSELLRLKVKAKYFGQYRTPETFLYR